MQPELASAVKRDAVLKICLASREKRSQPMEIHSQQRIFRCSSMDASNVIRDGEGKRFDALPRDGRRESQATGVSTYREGEPCVTLNRLKDDTGVAS